MMFKYEHNEENKFKEYWCIACKYVRMYFNDIIFISTKHYLIHNVYMNKQRILKKSSPMSNE